MCDGIARWCSVLGLYGDILQVRLVFWLFIYLYLLINAHGSFSLLTGGF